MADAATLRELAEKLRDKLGDAVVLVGAPGKDKAMLVLTVSKGLTDRYKAGDLIKGIAQMVGGSGGGRPDMAQAGGTDVAQARRGAREPLRAARLILYRACALGRARASPGRFFAGSACDLAGSGRASIEVADRFARGDAHGCRARAAPAPPARTAIRSGTASFASMTTSGFPSTQHRPPRPSSTPLPKGSARTATPRRAASASSSASTLPGVTKRERSLTPVRRAGGRGRRRCETLDVPGRAAENP